MPSAVNRMIVSSILTPRAISLPHSPFLLPVDVQSNAPEGPLVIHLIVKREFHALALLVLHEPHAEGLQDEVGRLNVRRVAQEEGRAGLGGALHVLGRGEAKGGVGAVAHDVEVVWGGWELWGLYVGRLGKVSNGGRSSEAEHRYVEPRVEISKFFDHPKQVYLIAA